ncbi:MAG: hypothetical protein LBU38_01940, partial [Propionibacteriaceae bacterium]|nr:hypothetical protein [Propionibacteriaceae bacterium]
MNRRTRAQEVSVDTASTRRDNSGTSRSLTQLARLIALACAVVDVVVFFNETAALPSYLRISALVLI